MGVLIDWKGKSGTKCLKEKDKCIKNYGSLHSFRESLEARNSHTNKVQLMYGRG